VNFSQFRSEVYYFLERFRFISPRSRVAVDLAFTRLTHGRLARSLVNISKDPIDAFLPSFSLLPSPRLIRDRAATVPRASLSARRAVTPLDRSFIQCIARLRGT